LGHGKPVTVGSNHLYRPAFDRAEHAIEHVPRVVFPDCECCSPDQVEKVGPRNCERGIGADPWEHRKVTGRKPRDFEPASRALNP
jgi:hypothetical protein